MSSRKPFEHPAAWYSADIRSKDDFVVHLGPRHVESLLVAVRQVKATGVDRDSMRVEQFALERIGDDVAAWRDEVWRGRGMLLLRGFPVNELSIEDVELAYIGLGLHFGRPVSQSNMGDLVGHVIDIGGKDNRERAYRNSRELHLHTDRCDHVGMLCLQTAMAGGVSGFASALTVHNEILSSHPDLLDP
ncbi:MAG: TauD/TfdA family dioxygenase, partial [Gammaproteobacteria bacterium]|nr:TauD/TfdA family dioxygenase [Gammaproteobacteria bacterium]